MGERSYLCWTISPEISCVIEYRADVNDNADILRMAESIQLPDVALYKFSEMPYKIADTVNYAVRTKTTTNQAAGDIRRYSRGISLLGYLLIRIAMFAICVAGDLPCLTFLEQQSDLATFFIYLGITEGVVLCLSTVSQFVVHVRYRKQTNDYIELKSQTKDSATFVLPDGREFHAKTDRCLQNMVDMLSNSERDE